MDKLAFPESARWHDGRLWFAHWGRGEVVAVGPDGATEVMTPAPDGYGWSVWPLPDGSRLTTGPALIRTGPDGSATEVGRLRDIAADAAGGIWCGAAGIRMMTGRDGDPAGAFVRVLDGGQVTDRIELDQPGFSRTLGGPEGTTLFMLTADWRGFDAIDAMVADRTGIVYAAEVSAAS